MLIIAAAIAIIISFAGAPTNAADLKAKSQDKSQDKIQDKAIMTHEKTTTEETTTTDENGVKKCWKMVDNKKVETPCDVDKPALEDK